jgi:Clp amino terminal domain, pathogenicity island component
MDIVPRVDRVIAAIEREHSGAGAQAQLAAAVDVAAQYRALGDQVLDHFVGAARAGGESWTAIGQVLGVSKQGAQQRFTAARPAPIAPWPAGFGPAAQAVVARSVDEARALGHRYVGTEHVLLGLLSDDGGLAAQVLARCGVTHDDVHARVVELIGRGQHPGDASLGMTPRTKRALEAARREARHVGHRCPEPEHLLLALYAVSQGVARDILEAAGASEAVVRAALADMIGAQAPEIADRIRHPRRRRRSRR